MADVVIQFAATFSSSLSILGSFYIICSYCQKKRDRTLSVQLDFTKDLIHILAWLDLIGGLGRVFGKLPKGNRATCQIQAIVIQFGDVAPIAWNFCLAFNLYQWVCAGHEQEKLRRSLKFYLAFTFLFTFALCVSPAIADVYGPKVQWCWITVEVWIYSCLYGWVVCAAISMIYLLVRVQSDIKKRFNQQCDTDAASAYGVVVHKLFLYCASFVVLWTPGLIDRSVEVINGKSVFICSLLHAFLVPIQGFVNAIIYGGFHTWVYNFVMKRHHLERVETFSDLANIGCSNFGMQSSKGNGNEGVASVFTSTFCMGGQRLPSNLDDWIPKNHDLYLIAVQECVNFDEIIQCMKDHVQLINKSAQFAAFSSVTSKVAQLILVREAEVDAGHFVLLSNKTTSHHGGSHSSNGIPFRYFDASIVFVGCNFGDRKRLRQKQLSVAKNRLRDTVDLIQNLRIETDEPGIDFPLVYHHTILCGNLNFHLNDLMYQQPIEEMNECVYGEKQQQHIFYAIKQAYQAEKKRAEIDQLLEGIYSNREQDCIEELNNFVDHDYYETVTAHEDDIGFSFLAAPNEISFNDEKLTNLTLDNFLDIILPSPSPPSSSNCRTHSCEEQERKANLFNMAIKVAEIAQSSWYSVLVNDELCNLMDTNEAFCGFEEADINFLPSFKRQIGECAQGDNIEDVFDLNSGSNSQNLVPAYSDRILFHSLSDQKDSLKSKCYWSCEEVKSSCHKPICSVLELKIDRFYSFNLQQNNRLDQILGNTLMKDKTNVFEYCVQLKNLDAVIWRPSITDVGYPNSSVSTARASEDEKLRSFSMFSMESGLRKSTSSSFQNENEITTVFPESVLTVFPIPSEDIFADQRKLYEVAASVKGGFTEAKEWNSCYQNTKYFSWEDALTAGIKHSAITKSVNGVLHMAIKISGKNGSTGGQGILCLQDISSTSTFDIQLTWGGQHVGYLHGEVCMKK